MRFTELYPGALQDTNHRIIKFELRENAGMDGEGVVDISYSHTFIRVHLSGQELTATTQTGMNTGGMEIKLNGRLIGRQDSLGRVSVCDADKSTLTPMPDSRERRFLWARVQGLGFLQSLRYADHDYSLLVADDAVLASFAGNPFNGAPLLTASDAEMMRDWSAEKQWCAFTLCLQRLGRYRLEQNRDPQMEGRPIPDIPSCALLAAAHPATISISPRDWHRTPSLWDKVLERSTRWSQCFLIPLIPCALAYSHTLYNFLGLITISLLLAWAHYGLSPERSKSPRHFPLRGN